MVLPFEQQRAIRSGKFGDKGLLCVIYQWLKLSVRLHQSNYTNLTCHNMDYILCA